LSKFWAIFIVLCVSVAFAFAETAIIVGNYNIGERWGYSSVAVLILAIAITIAFTLITEEFNLKEQEIEKRVKHAVTEKKYALDKEYREKLYMVQLEHADQIKKIKEEQQKLLT